MVPEPRRRRFVEVACVVALLAAGWAIRARVHQGWAFAGSDSYGYLKLAHELRFDGRYALGPPPEPLAWVRPPLYPIFLALVQPRAEMSAPWDRFFAVQIALDLLTALCVFLLARRLAGALAGLVALTLAVANPFSPPFTAAMLTETLATFLATATVTAIVFGAARPRRWWPLGGALVALSTLLRPDGLMLAIAFAPPLLLAGVSRREKLGWAAAGLLGFVVVFAPWPIRNLARVGAAHPIGGRIDRYSRPVENYEGYWSWLRSWSRDWISMTTPTTCFYDVGCPAGLSDLRARGAYVDVDDEAEVQRLIAARFRDGLTPEVSRGFARLADARRRAHPLLVEAWLPLSRAWSMWAAPFDELLQSRLPWPQVMTRLRPRLRAIATVQWVAMLLAGALLTARRRTRSDAGALFATVLTRTFILGYTFYCMPRYALEVMPLGWVLIGAGAFELGRLAAAASSTLRARRNPVSSSG